MTINQKDNTIHSREVIFPHSPGCKTILHNKSQMTKLFAIGHIPKGKTSKWVLEGILDAISQR